MILCTKTSKQTKQTKVMYSLESLVRVFKYKRNLGCEYTGSSRKAHILIFSLNHLKTPQDTL